MKKINFKRLVARNNRLILAYEKKYAKEIGRALQKQLKGYLKTGILNDEITPILTDLYMSVGELFYLNHFYLLSDISQYFFFFNDTATTEIYTRSLVGSVNVWKRQVSPKVARSFGISPSATAARTTWPALSLIHISEPTRQAEISYAVFCLKKKK